MSFNVQGLRTLRCIVTQHPADGPVACGVCAKSATSPMPETHTPLIPLSSYLYIKPLVALTNMGHLLQEGRLHAARAELVHPEGGFVLQGRSAWVKSVREVVV